MTLSAFVFQTFLVTKSMLANAMFSIFKMATMIFKMAVKLIIIKQIKTNLWSKLVFLRQNESRYLFMYHTERRLHSCLSYSSVEKQTGSKMADKTIKIGNSNVGIVKLDICACKMFWLFFLLNCSTWENQWCHQINHKEIYDGIQDGFQNLLILKMTIIML